MFGLMLSNERPLRLLSAIHEIAGAYCIMVEGALDKAAEDHASMSASPSFVRAHAAMSVDRVQGGSMREMELVLQGTLEALEVRPIGRPRGDL